MNSRTKPESQSLCRLFRVQLAAVLIALSACSSNDSSPSDTPTGPVQITVQLSGTGSGQISGAGIACGSDCNETVAVGSTITLQASASTGSQFNGWGDACPGLNTTCTVTVQAARTVVASFVPIGAVPVTVQLSGTGSGQVSGAGIACGSDCNETVAVGSTITLQASASTGSQFNGWGDACQGLNTTCTVTVQAARTVIASFVPAQPVQITVQLSGSGSGQVSGAGIACGSDCNETVAIGTTITLQASASAGSQFDGWGGACQGLSTSCTVTIQAARTVVASFVPPRTLNQAVDAVIAAMPANSWKVLPNTQLGSICPAPYQGYYCTSVVTAWSGGAYDQRRDRMIVYGGGHSDSFYNIMFSFDLATMRWERLNEMGGGATGDTAGSGWTDIRFESCGFYPRGVVGSLPSDVMLARNTNYIDPAKCSTEPVLSLLDLQQPRSAHTYGKVVVDWLRDRYCYIGGDTFPSSQMDSYVAYCFDPHSRSWSLVAERPRTATGRGNAALDASGNWWYLTDGNANILKYDSTSNRWTEYGNINFEAAGGADIDRLRNQMYAMVVSGDSYVMRRFDLGSSAALNARPAYTQLSGVVGTPSNLGTRPGLVYADNRDRFFAWGGGANVHVFDPQTQAWTTLAGTGDAPGAQQANGTFGRWRYSAARRVFVLVNSTTQDVYLYKPPN